MTDELRAWLEELRHRRVGSETVAVLIAKCEELAEALEEDQKFSREVATCNDCRKAVSLYCINHASKLLWVAQKRIDALRAPGGGECS